MTQDQIIEKGLEVPDKWRNQVQAITEMVAVVSEALQQLATVFFKASETVIRDLAIWLRRCGFANQLIYRWRLHSRLACWIAWHLPDSLILKLPEGWWKTFPMRWRTGL